MKKILSTILGIALLTALTTITYAETSDSHVNKAPQAQAKTASAEEKVNEAETSKNNMEKAPAQSKAPQAGPKTPPAQVKTTPRVTSRDDENPQSTPPVSQLCRGVGGIVADLNLKVDASVQAFLGCEIIQILAQPERVESFLIGLEQGQPKPGANLTKAEIKLLQQLLFSEDSYYFGFSKRCPFEPEMGLRFVTGQQSVDILLSFDCNLWAFFYQGEEEKLEDFDSVQAPLLTLARSLFSPNR